MTGSRLFVSVCDRYVLNRVPVPDMRDDLRRAFRMMLGDGYDCDQLKKLLNQTHLPTVSGKNRWTLGEIRGLTK